MRFFLRSNFFRFFTICFFLCSAQSASALSVGEAWQLFKEESFSRASSYVYEEAKVELLNKIKDQDWWARQLSKISPKLKDKINAALEKPAPESELLALVEADFLKEYPTNKVGTMQAYALYSPNFAVQKLIWDRQESVHNCYYYGVESKCEEVCDGYGCSYSCRTVPVYKKTTYLIEADYSIYRVMNGVETFVQTIDGRVSANSSNLLKLSDIWKEVTGGNAVAGLGQHMWVDFDANTNRSRGESLKYRIYANTAPNNPSCVSSASTWQSFVQIDADGDLIQDQVPWGVVNQDLAGALIASISILL